MLIIKGAPRPPLPRSDGRTETTEGVTLPGLLALAPGRECTVEGLGRCRYHSAVLDPDGTVAWLTVIDAKRRSFRTATPERVTTVHRTVKMRSE